jgi:hypothetical protein
MKTTTIAKKLFLLSTGILMTTMMWAQKPSPAATATGKIKDATITIHYSSPGVKGRPIWGTSLVPYDKVWRAGANEATIFETDKDIKVEGKKLPAGKYSLYIYVTENKGWTIIFNSNTVNASNPTRALWGITNTGETTEDPAKDVLRVEVKPVKSETFNERLVYVINDKGFSLDWENLHVPVKIK